MTRNTLISARSDAYTCDRATKGFRRENSQCAIVHLGGLAAIHSAAPPPVAEYDRWLSENSSERSKGTRSRFFNMTGARLRRAVVMRRQGSTLKECGAAIGLTASWMKHWLGRLPQGLAA